jgi:hypothetical protein
MKTIIKKTDTIQEINKKLDAIKNKRGFDAFKFCGVLKLEKTPLQIQKEMRNEWK